MKPTSPVLAVLLIPLALSAAAQVTTLGNPVVGTTAYPNGGMRRVSKMTMTNANERGLYGATYDGSRYAYFSTANSVDPAVVIKVDVSGFLPVEVGRATCTAGIGEVNLDSAAIDVAAGYAYFGTTANPGRIVKIKLDDGTGQPVCLGSTPLANGENNAFGMVIDTTDPDPTKHDLLVGTVGSPGWAVKVAPGAGDNLPIRRGAVQFSGVSGENAVRRVILDTRDPSAANHAAVFGTIGANVVFVKVAYGAGANPVRIGATTQDAGDKNIGSAGFDPATGLAYFGSYLATTETARVIKVNVGGPGVAPVRVTHLPLSANEIQLATGVIDPAGGFMIFGTDHVYPADIYKVDLSSFSETPKLVLNGGTQPNQPLGTNVLNNPETLYGEVFLQSSVIDTARGYAWVGTDSAKGQVVQLAYSPKGAIWGQRVVLASPSAIGKLSFYAHQAKGSFRVGIYDEPSKNLVWQSGAVATAAGWNDVPISAGSPVSLNLASGTYWLAFSVDSVANVPSWSAGVLGDSFRFEANTGAIPAAAPAAPSLVQTSNNWSLSATACGQLTGPANTLLLTKSAPNTHLAWGTGSGATGWNVRRCAALPCAFPITGAPSVASYDDANLADGFDAYYLAEARNDCATAP